MAHFPDLSQHPYIRLDERDRAMLTVGWLAAGESFATGPFPSDLLACILDLCRTPDVLTLGSHDCDLCPPPEEGAHVAFGGGLAALGNGEIHVEGDNGIVYAAPTLIYHYIRDHDYAPPQQFTDALHALCAHRSPEPQTGRQFYEAALDAFHEELGVLRTAYPQLTAVAARLIFFDLRAKTKFGRLTQVEDVRAILLHRGPQLSEDEAPDAAAELWAAWHRFLGHEDFEADWLQLSGPRERHPCPCCGFLTFSAEVGGTYVICPVCYWEDDTEDFDEPHQGHHGPNYGISLNAARDNFRRFGASHENYIESVRRPLPDELPPDVAD